jgi:hypothetical protein
MKKLVEMIKTMRDAAKSDPMKPSALFIAIACCAIAVMEMRDNRVVSVRPPAPPKQVAAPVALAAQATHAETSCVRVGTSDKCEPLQVLATRPFATALITASRSGDCVTIKVCARLAFHSVPSAGARQPCGSAGLQAKRRSPEWTRLSKPAG